MRPNSSDQSAVSVKDFTPESHRIPPKCSRDGCNSTEFVRGESQHVGITMTVAWTCVTCGEITKTSTRT